MQMPTKCDIKSPASRRVAQLMTLGSVFAFFATNAYAQPATPAAVNADEQSCRKFVQDFYDWYWNQFADDADKPSFDMRREHDYHQVVRLHPPVLSPELIELIKKDEKCSKRSQGICNLDFDPFWGNQDAQGKYTVGRVVVKGDRCDVKIVGQQVAPELGKSGSKWLFTNFHYPFYSEDGKTMEAPDSDLVQILK